MICPGFTAPLYFFYVPDLPGILYYSYVPAIVVSLLVGTIVIWNDRKALLNQLLFAICAAFLVWTFATLVTWTNIHSEIVLFAWSLLGPAAGFISILSIYYAYVIIDCKDVGPRIKLAFIALILPLLVL